MDTELVLVLQAFFYSTSFSISSITSSSTPSSFMIDGKIAGAILFTGLYKIDSYKVSLSIKEIVEFILSKKIKTILNTNPIFTKPKTPPNIMFNNDC